MESLRLVRGFKTLEAAAAAVNALCDAGVEHGAIGLRAASAGVYLVVVQAADASELALIEQVLAGIGIGSPAAGEQPLPAHTLR